MNERKAEKESGKFGGGVDLRTLVPTGSDSRGPERVLDGARCSVSGPAARAKTEVRVSALIWNYQRTGHKTAMTEG